MQIVFGRDVERPQFDLNWVFNDVCKVNFVLIEHVKEERFDFHAAKAISDAVTRPNPEWQVRS